MSYLINKYIRLFFLLFYLFSSNFTFSQTIDDLNKKLSGEKNLNVKIQIHSDIGHKYFKKGNLKESLDHFFKSLSLAEKLDDKNSKASAYQNIGVVFRENEKYKESEEYLRKGLRLFLLLEKSKDIGNCYHSLGNLYYMQYEDSLSEVCYKKAIEYYISSGDSLSLVNAYNSLGALFFEMGDTLKGISTMKKSLDYLPLKDTLLCFETFLSLAEVFTYSNNKLEARKFIDKCEILLPSVKAIQVVDDFYYMLYYYHKENGDYYKSLHFYKKYITYRDSIMNNDNQRQLDELNIQYKTDKKVQQIRYLHAKNSNNRLIISKQKWVIFSLVLSGIFTILIGFKLFGIFKRKIAKQKDLELEKQKELERKRIARDMHDEIGAGITRIGINNEQIKLYLKDDAGSEAFKCLDKVEFESKQLSRNLGEIIWGLNPQNDNLETLLAYIRRYMYDFLDEAGINAIIDFPSNIPNRNLSPEFRRNVFLVVKEALNNCVKYANADEARLSIHVESNKMSLIFSDNGKGFNLNSFIRGNGLNNMESRTKDILGIFELKTSPGNGVEIHIKELKL